MALAFEDLNGNKYDIPNTNAGILLEADLYFGRVHDMSEVLVTKLGYSPNTMSVKYSLAIVGKGTFGYYEADN